MEDKKFYVYGHIRPDNQEVFYVGLGSNNRKYSKHHRNAFWHNVYNKNENKINLVIFYENLTFEEACEKEIELINFYGRKDLNKGSLVNLTNGGEGTSRIIVTKEKSERCRIAISKALKEKYSKEPHHSLGCTLSEERKENNRIKMLEWHKNNTIDYSNNSGSKQNQFKGYVYMLDKSTDEILNIFEGTGDAMRQTGIHSGKISGVINGLRKTAGGYKWERIINKY